MNVDQTKVEDQGHIPLVQRGRFRGRIENGDGVAHHASAVQLRGRRDL